MLNGKQGIASIHALRGVGALAVVIYHAESLFPQFNFKMGAAGVDLFFVISGIVMQLALDPKGSPLGFLRRRVVRVVPMYWITTAAAVLYYNYRHPGYPPSAEYIVRSLLFLPPPNGFQMPFLYPGWTLNFEMFFYLVLAGAIAVRKHPMLLTGCLVTLIGSLSIALGPEASPYYANPLILEFVIGLCMGQAVKQGISVSRTQGAMLLVTALALYVLHNVNKSSGVLAWGLPAVLLILGGFAFEKSVVVNNRLARAAGDASYSIYLVHPFPIWFMERQASGATGPGFFIAAIAASVVLGCACHILLEKPLTRLLSGRRWLDSNRSPA